MAGGIGTIDGMARELGLSREDMEARLGQLEHMGYIEQLPEHVFDPRSSGCMGCRLSSRCADGEGPAVTGKTFMLTDKGVKVAFE